MVYETLNLSVKYDKVILYEGQTQHKQTFSFRLSIYFRSRHASRQQ